MKLGLFSVGAGRAAQPEVLVRIVQKEEAPQFHGEFCDFPPVGLYPKPIQQPHPPILFGGESEPALRRVVEVGDGWLGFNVSPAEAGQAVDRMRQIAAEIGRDFTALDISAGPYSKLPRVDLDSLKRYRDVGVQRVVLINTTTRLEQIDAALEDLGNTLVQPAQQL